MRRALKTVLAMAIACVAGTAVLAAPAGASPKITADYRFEGNFKSSNGSVANLHPEELIRVCPCAKFRTTKVGGTKQGVWQWLMGDGLRLKDAAAALGHHGRSYTFVMLVKLDTVDGYRKLIDFDNLLADAGIYTYNGVLYPYPHSVDTTGTFVQPGDWFQIVVTRDASGELKGYGGGVCAPGDPCLLMHHFFTVSDSDRYEVLGADKVLHFLEDDQASGGTEATGGEIARLRIYDDPLSRKAIKHLGS
jgi:hypothetical protein